METNESTQEATTEKANMLEEAQQLLNNRMSHVNALIESEKTLNELTEKLDEHNKSHKQLWRDALKAGWTESELKKVGIKDPIKKRSRSKKSANNSVSAEQTSAETGAEKTSPVTDNGSENTLA